MLKTEVQISGCLGLSLQFSDQLHKSCTQYYSDQVGDGAKLSRSLEEATVGERTVYVHDFDVPVVLKLH
jgi:hypothetical protein